MAVLDFSSLQPIISDCLSIDFDRTKREIKTTIRVRIDLFDSEIPEGLRIQAINMIGIDLIRSHRRLRDYLFALSCGYRVLCFRHISIEMESPIQFDERLSIDGPFEHPIQHYVCRGISIS